MRRLSWETASDCVRSAVPPHDAMNKIISGLAPVLVPVGALIGNPPVITGLVSNRWDLSRPGSRYPAPPRLTLHGESWAAPFGPIPLDMAVIVHNALTHGDHRPEVLGRAAPSREEAIPRGMILPDDEADTQHPSGTGTGLIPLQIDTVAPNGPALMPQPISPGARSPAATVMTGFGAIQRYLDALADRKPRRGFRDGTAPTVSMPSMSADISARACRRSRGWRSRYPSAASAS